MRGVCEGGGAVRGCVTRSGASHDPEVSLYNPLWAV